jgi:hypothetical protein
VLVKNLLEEYGSLQKKFPAVYNATKRNREGIALSAASLVSGAVSERSTTRTSVRATTEEEEDKSESVAFGEVTVPLDVVKQTLHNDDVLLDKLGLVAVKKAGVALTVLDSLNVVWQLLKRPSWSNTNVVTQLRSAIATAVVPIEWGAECTRVAFHSLTGMRQDYVDAAQKRRRRLMSGNLEQSVEEAILSGDFLYDERGQREDTTPADVIAMVKVHAHSPDVAQPLGDKNREKKESRKAGAPSHPKHNLLVTVAKAYEMFKVSPAWIQWKLANKWEHNIGYTVYKAAFKCFCHAPMKAEECACEIHSQMAWLLEALNNTQGRLHGRQCNCPCSHCEGGDCAWLAKVAHDLGSFAQAVLCDKIMLFTGDEASLVLNKQLVYQSACVKGVCGECGPHRRLGEQCQHYHGNIEDEVKVKFWDTTEASGKKYQKQVVEKEMKVCDLLAQVIVFFKMKYILHHYSSKVQRAMFDVAGQTMKPVHLHIYTDFAEKFKLSGCKVVTCGTAASATLMIAIVHYYANRGDEQHTTDVWIFISDDKKQDAAFHAYAMRKLTSFYTGQFPKERVVVFTDGCGKQYKGVSNFIFVSQFWNEFSGAIMEHNFAVTSHFKGVHDGMGGTVKRLASHAVIKQEEVMNTAEQFADFVKRKFKDKSADDYLKDWTPNRIKNYHVEFIESGDVTRVVEEKEGVEGTLKTYQFTGMYVDQPPVVVVADEKAREEGLPFRLGCKVGQRSFSCYCSQCREQQHEQCLLQAVHPHTFTPIVEQVITAMQEGAGAEVTEKAIMGLLVAGLKTLCRQHQLADTGKKDQLRHRLLSHFGFLNEIVAVDKGIELQQSSLSPAESGGGMEMDEGMAANDANGWLLGSFSPATNSDAQRAQI